MFLEFYGLREQPFGVTPDPRYLYASDVHREALASLIYGIENKLGFAGLVAEPGMGKTTLLFMLLERYRETAYTALVGNVQRDCRDLLISILWELGVKTTETDYLLLYEQLKQFMFDAARQSKHVLVIIDEAQNLDYAILESVRLLSNFETPQAKLLHIVLAGQPKLSEQLLAPEMRQLLQRIPIISRLEPFSAEHSAAYVAHRLRIAGYRGRQLFSDAALALIAKESGGVPRNINALCFNALSLGRALRRTEIGTDILAEVIADRENALAAAATTRVVRAAAAPAETVSAVQDTTRSVAHSVASAVAIPMAAPEMTAPCTPISQPPQSTASETPEQPPATWTQFANPQTHAPPPKKRTGLRPVLAYTFVALLLGVPGVIAWRGAAISASGDVLPPPIANAALANPLPDAFPEAAKVGVALPTGAVEKSTAHLRAQGVPVLEIRSGAAQAPSPAVPPLPRVTLPSFPALPTPGFASRGVDRPNSATVVSPLKEQAVAPSIVPARVLARQPIKYLPSSRSGRADGSVTVMVKVDANGTASSTQVTRSNVSPPLVSVALESIRRWRFAPAMLNGRPVEGMVEITVQFRSPE